MCSAPEELGSWPWGQAAGQGGALRRSLTLEGWRGSPGSQLPRPVWQANHWAGLGGLILQRGLETVRWGQGVLAPTLPLDVWNPSAVGAFLSDTALAQFLHPVHQSPGD